MGGKPPYLLVGLFVLLLLAGLGGFTVWLLKGGDDRRYASYTLYFGESITGLGVGGPVRYRGVEVGNVASIAIDPKNPQRVMVSARIADTTPLRADTFATLKPQGITGLSYIDLSGGVANSPPLPRPSRGKRVVIPTRPSPLAQIFTSTPELIARFSLVAERLTNLISEKNVSSFSNTLDNLDRLTSNINRRTKSIDTLTQEAVKTARSIAALSEDLRQLTSHSRQDTEQLIAQTRQSMTELNTLLSNANAFSSSGYQELHRLLLEMRRAARDVRQLSRGLREDPSRVLYPPTDETEESP